jgi:hypothetical protein
MADTAEKYAARAEECIRLASMARDEMVQRRLLDLRQEYLAIARSLTKDHPAETAT